MAKARIRLPRLHTKTAILAALVLFLPIIVLVASSKQLQDTRSSAAQSVGDGGGKAGGSGSVTSCGQLIPTSIGIIQQTQEVVFRLNTKLTVPGSKYIVRFIGGELEFTKYDYYTIADRNGSLRWTKTSSQRYPSIDNNSRFVLYTANNQKICTVRLAVK